MRPGVAAMLLALLGCSGGTATRSPPADPSDTRHSQLADDDAYRPSYGPAELQKALIAERGAEATGERIVAELDANGSADRLLVAQADLAVRRQFIASLEVCWATGNQCPPRLDDPPWSYDLDPDGTPPAPKLDAPLRFDLDSWRVIAVELHGRACACRTIACVDSLGVAIDALEPRPMPEVQGDDAATISITRARECLFRLRGKALPRSQPGLEPAAD